MNWTANNNYSVELLDLGFRQSDIYAHNGKTSWWFRIHASFYTFAAPALLDNRLRMHNTFLAEWSNISSDRWHKGLQCFWGHSQCHSDQRSKNPGFTGILYSSLCFKFIKKNNSFVNSRKKTCWQHKKGLNIMPSLCSHSCYNLQLLLPYLPSQNIKCINTLYKIGNLKYWSFTAWCEKFIWASYYIHSF